MTKNYWETFSDTLKFICSFQLTVLPTPEIPINIEKIIFDKIMGILIFRVKAIRRKKVKIYAIEWWNVVAPTKNQKSIQRYVRCQYIENEWYSTPIYQWLPNEKLRDYQIPEMITDFWSQNIFGVKLVLIFTVEQTLSVRKYIQNGRELKKLSKIKI